MFLAPGQTLQRIVLARVFLLLPVSQSMVALKEQELAKKMVQSLKCLLSKHEDLSLIPGTPIKSRARRHAPIIPA